MEANKNICNNKGRANYGIFLLPWTTTIMCAKYLFYISRVIIVVIHLDASAFYDVTKFVFV